jgi:uncharacterized integral membrane protein
MVTLAVVFLIVALVLFILAAINVAGARFNLVAAGLAFWVAAVILGSGKL